MWGSCVFVCASWLECVFGFKQVSVASETRLEQICVQMGQFKVSHVKLICVSGRGPSAWIVYGTSRRELICQQPDT